MGIMHDPSQIPHSVTLMGPLTNRAPVRQPRLERNARLPCAEPNPSLTCCAKYWLICWTTSSGSIYCCCRPKRAEKSDSFCQSVVRCIAGCQDCCCQALHSCKSLTCARVLHESCFHMISSLTGGYGVGASWAEP